MTTAFQSLLLSVLVNQDLSFWPAYFSMSTYVYEMWAMKKEKKVTGIGRRNKVLPEGCFVYLFGSRYS